MAIHLFPRVQHGAIAMKRTFSPQTGLGCVALGSVWRISTVLLLSAAVTGQTAAIEIVSSPVRKAAITSPARDLELFFAIKLPLDSTVPGNPNTDTWALGLPAPPSVSLRDMLTATELPQSFSGKTRFALERRAAQGWTRVSIKPMALAAVASFSPQSSQVAPIYGLELSIERLQPGASVSVTSAGGEVTDRYAFGEPLLRTTLDGSVYEAAPVTVERNGAPYTTLYFGYRIGLVAAQTAAGVPTAQREYYELVSLPAPTVEGRVTEYIYRPIADAATPRVHVFYTANEAERTVLDNDENWMRSGYEFKSGGYVPVCRFFYKPPNGGPSTHVYTARVDECQQLKSTAGFTYEGTPYRVSLPRPAGTGPLGVNDPARCPEKTRPVWRFFNQPTDSSVAPNHRYVLNAITGLIPIPRWTDEGIAFCVPE